MDGVTSGYAAFPSVRAKELKSITPFAFSNRHGSSAIINVDKTAAIIVNIVNQDIIITKTCSRIK